MAKQAGIIRLTGPLGNLSFYEMDGEFYVRRQTCHAVATDPRFKKTHLAGLDFGTASRASKLLRKAFGPAIIHFSDIDIASRLSGRFVSIVRADTARALGQRKVLKSNLHLLKGFEFNKHQAFDPSRIATTVSVNRVTGQVTLSLSTASRKLAHTELVAAIASVNFADGTCTRHDSTTFTLGKTKSRELTLTTSAHTDPRAVIIVTLGTPSTTPGEPGAMAIIAACPETSAMQQRPAPASNKIKRSFQMPQKYRKPIPKAPRFHQSTLAHEKSPPEKLTGTFPLVRDSATPLENIDISGTVKADPIHVILNLFIYII